MNAYDYDAPTQLLKVTERNHRYADITQTIPKGVLYPMCSMNVAFNRELMGPAFMQGLMGKGQPWARYDDMFAGWASKVVGDHVGYGTRSGAPYIYHNKASNPFTNLKKEYMGLDWQEKLIPFFEKVQLSPTTDAAEAYIELADKMQAEFKSLNPYFERLGEAMRRWVKLWKRRRIHDIPLVASRSSLAPASSETTCALVTVVHNEGHDLPIWIRYYQRIFNPRDMFILDHFSVDGSTDPDKIPEGITVRKLTGDVAFMPHHYLNEQVELFQQRLLRAGYKCVLFTEVDEFIAANPEKYPQGLQQYLKEFLIQPTLVKRASGYNLVQNVEQGEKEIHYDKDILAQRSYWSSFVKFDKPLLSKIPLKYGPGFHGAAPLSPAHRGAVSTKDPDLALLHTHFVDLKHCMARETAKHEAAIANMHKSEVEEGSGEHFVAKTFQKEAACTKHAGVLNVTHIPVAWKSVVI